MINKSSPGEGETLWHSEERGQKIESYRSTEGYVVFSGKKKKKKEVNMTKA